MDPKLKQARAEIEAILKKHDIAGHVVLHNAPGEGEVFMNVEPSYSRVTMVHDDTSGQVIGMRLRSKLEEYNGDREAQRKDLEASLNMVSLFGNLLGMAAMAFISTSEKFDKATGVTHTPIRRTDEGLQ